MVGAESLQPTCHGKFFRQDPNVTDDKGETPLYKARWRDGKFGKGVKPMGLNLASPGHGYSNWSPTLPKTHTLPLKTGNIQKNNRGSACFMGELVVLPSIFSLKTGGLLIFAYPYPYPYPCYRNPSLKVSPRTRRQVP